MLELSTRIWRGRGMLVACAAVMAGYLVSAGLLWSDYSRGARQVEEARTERILSGLSAKASTGGLTLLQVAPMGEARRQAPPGPGL